ncbi:Protein nedd1 [Podochytrium sp. JEL0797]|nr:Protein nedd1 [Podochytrium sp. JEL0797]
MAGTTAAAATRLAVLTGNGEVSLHRVGPTAHSKLVKVATEGGKAGVWSADGRFVGIALADGGVKVISAADGSVAATLPRSVLEHRAVAAIAFGPRRASRFLYLACGRSVVVWDTRESKIAHRFGTHTRDISAIALSVDETSLASAATNGEMRIHSLKTNTSSSLASPLTKTVNHCAFSPFKKSTIAAVGDDGSVVVWDSNLSPQPMFVVKDAHKAPIHGLAWSPCNKSLFATAGFDRKVLVYNKDENGKILLKFETDSPITSLSVNDDFMIAAGSMSGKITVFDVRTRKSTLFFHATQTGDAIVSLAFEPPQWAQETSHRDQGGSSSSAAAKQRQTSAGAAATAKPRLVSKQSSSSSLSSTATSVEPAPPASGSPVVAALKERMAAVKDKQSLGLMDLFSPVKPAFRQDLFSDAKIGAQTGHVNAGNNLHHRLRQVLSAEIDDDKEDEKSEEVHVTPLVLNRAQTQQPSHIPLHLQEPAKRDPTLDLFSPLASSKSAPKTPPTNPSTPPFRLSTTTSTTAPLTNESDNPFLSTTTTTTTPSLPPSVTNLPTSTAAPPPIDPIARLQNALNQLKSKTPMKPPASSSSAGPATPFEGTQPPSDAGTPPPPLPQPPLRTATAGTHTPQKSRSASNTGTTATIFKNLPGSPGHVAVSAPTVVVSGSSLLRDDEEVLEASTVGGLEEDTRRVVEQMEEALGAFEEVGEGEGEDDGGIWMSKEVVGGEEGGEGKGAWFGGGGMVGAKPTQQQRSLSASVDTVSGKLDAKYPLSSDGGDGGNVAGGGGGGYAHKVLEAVLDSCLDEFRKQVKEDIQNMHVELLRQFYIQKNEIGHLFAANSPTDELLREVVRLREENARLRCGFQ